MSRKEQRNYLEYDFVRLTKAVPAAPPNAATLDVFNAKGYRFFVERGMFCIECRKTGTVLDFPPAQVHFGQRTPVVLEEVAES